MKNILVYIASLAVLLTFGSCNDWLETDSNTILTDEEVWSNEELISNALANLYSRIPQEVNLEIINGHAILDDAMWSGLSTTYENNNTFGTYPYDWFYSWDYTLIRDINQALENCKKAQIPNISRIKVFEAEIRFIRAQVYFEMVKRMGGVPIITSVYSYEPGMDIGEYQFKRAKEHEVYDFVASEIDAIASDLAPNNTSRNRANQYAALALKSRAMLYAASIAKYSALKTPEIGNALSTGEVAMTGCGDYKEYYRKSLEAAEKIINDGVFKLMDGKQDAENFYNAICKKEGNTEVIMAREYSLTLPTTFTYLNLARSQREAANSGSSITPSLNLVDAYEYLDGSDGKIQDVDAAGNYIFYDTPDGPFKNKDVRLAGTVLYPGSSFRSPLSIQAGVYYFSGRKYAFASSDSLGTTYSDGGMYVGADGPHLSLSDVSNTGFYLRKFVDEKTGSGVNTTGSEMWWVMYRMGEVYLNAAEAAFELGDNSKALRYINNVRYRAGFGENSLSSLSIERIQNERRCELAFEDHRIWDAKRWRIAHEKWNGSTSNENSVIMALFPYRVVGGPQDGKYIFVRRNAARVILPHNFRVGSYYTAIPADVLSNNPNLVRNPLQY